MATSLAQLLDNLGDTARTTDDSAAARADAALALGHLGRALARLHRDGVSSGAGDRRGQQVAGLAAACSEVAARAPATESTLTLLAAAAADTVGVQNVHTSVASRWGAATAVAETVTPLAEVIGPRLPPGPAAEWLAEVERQAALVQQTAAMLPPSRADAVLLDRPIPGRAVVASADPALVVPDAIGVLIQATSRAAAPPSVTEVLAFTIAAQTLSHAAERVGPFAQPTAGEATAADAWRAVRACLRPYDDGSRHLHPDVPVAVHAAGRVHAVLRHLPSDVGSWPEPLPAAVTAAAQHLPTLANQLLHRSIRSWAATGALLAYARDLPPREDRVAAYLRGYRTGGVVRADAVDLRPVIGALHNARLLSVAVAAQAAERGRAAPDFPRRAWAAHRARLDQPETAAAISSAQQETYRQLQAPRRRPAGPHRGR